MTSTIARKIILPLIALLSTATAFGQGREKTPDIALDVLRPGQFVYNGDSVIVGVKVSIPKGFHLYANPLGPGIGKPLDLYVNKIDTSAFDVRWAEARKSAPRRYDPPIGDWVWAYNNEAYFFLKGAPNNDRSTCADCYEIIVDALICKTSCVPVVKRAVFGLPFQKELPWPAQLAKSKPMEFKVGVPDDQSPFFDNDDDSPLAGLDIDLIGLLPPGALTAITDSSLVTGIPLDAQTLVAADGGGGAIDWDYVARDGTRREYNLLTAIIFALVAGLALNLTPCIFPVLGIRVLSFAESARECRRRALTRSFAFAGGIVAVFLLLAALAAFAGLSWGHQFQNPAVMVGVIAMIFLFALGMFDFYTLGVPSSIGAAERKTGANLSGDFLKGAMATVMATPCGGPFLGALLAWALLQHPVVIFAIFAVMGAGMALPYVLLSSSKRLFKLLPKPGRWIDDFKRVMGFLLVAFAVNLLRSLDSRLVVTAVGVCMSVFCAASVNRRLAPFGSETKRRVAAGLFAVALLAAGIAVSVTYLRVNAPYLADESAIDEFASVKWQTFSPSALRNAHEEGRSVIVNFTAAWCTNCKLNKAVALDAPAAREIYADKNILLLTADITNHNPRAQELMSHLGSRSVPFLAIFPADAPKSPVIMRDIISRDRYLEAIGELP